MTSAWQLIDTAPIEGTFLVWLKESDRTMGSNIALMRSSPKTKFVNGNFHFDHAPATHWQPLPEGIEI